MRPSRFTHFPYASRYHMSPLWGFGVFGACRPCYKHVAPLGLKARTEFALHPPSYWLGFQAALGWVTQPLRIQLSRFPVCVRMRPCVKFPLRFTLSHVAPLGLWVFGA